MGDVCVSLCVHESVLAHVCVCYVWMCVRVITSAFFYIGEYKHILSSHFCTSYHTKYNNKSSY